MPQTDSGSPAFGRSLTTRPDGSRLPLFNQANRQAEQVRRMDAPHGGDVTVGGNQSPAGLGGAPSGGFRSRMKRRRK